MAPPSARALAVSAPIAAAAAIAAALAVMPAGRVAAQAETGDRNGVSTSDSIAVAAADADAGDAATTDLEIVDPLEPRDAGAVALDDFIWTARPIIIFADSPADPRVAEQLRLLADRPEPLLQRDVVVIVDTDPAASSAIRTSLRPRGFALVIMQKDGAVGLRRPSPRDVREIIRAIDNFSDRR